MADPESETSNKREHEDVDAENDDELVGPLPSEAAKPKKRKVLEYEQVYLDNLPKCEAYEISYMHRDVVSFLVVTKNNFIVTASVDGHVKFWKKVVGAGIEFVKHFRSHLAAIVGLAASANGEFCCTIAEDSTLKVFDVVNFDMINMIKLGYVPSCCCWIFSPGDAVSALAVSQKGSPVIRIYEAHGSKDPLHTIDKLHSQPITHIKFNAAAEAVASTDSGGMIEFWTGPKSDYKFPKNVRWEYKTDTDLYEFAKSKTSVLSLEFSPNGLLMATFAKDRQIRVFKFMTGKLSKVLDESVKVYTELQQTKTQMSNLEFGRRLAIEKELEKSPAFSNSSIMFDESSNFLIYPTMLGVKIINLTTNRCARILGKSENARFLNLGLFQGTVQKLTAALTLEMEASENPILKEKFTDPILLCTAFKKNRFYLFTDRNPNEMSDEKERDVFNEKPSKEEMAAATQDVSYTRISDSAVIHTSLGDLTVKLYPKECPKTVENFCVHARNGYYNGHIFHRVIKGFMIQTGDPLGTGTGGESIWGGEFEDEFHPKLKHDKGYTLSMANAGPNTNGSQFFITVCPTPWLDNKHTVFGLVTKGMDSAQAISKVKTNPKTDKPHDEIRIVSITVK